MKLRKGTAKEIEGRIGIGRSGAVNARAAVECAKVERHRLGVGTNELDATQDIGSASDRAGGISGDEAAVGELCATGSGDSVIYMDVGWRSG